MPQSESSAFGMWVFEVVQDIVFLVLGAVFYVNTENEVCPGPIRPLVLGCFVVSGIKLFLNLVVGGTRADGPNMLWAIAILLGSIATYAEMAVYAALGWVVWWGDYGTSSECHHTSSTIWIWARVAGMIGLVTFVAFLFLLVRNCVTGHLPFRHEFGQVAMRLNADAPAVPAPPVAEQV